MTEGTKRRILVVDDEITVCKSIRQALLSDDYDIDTALSGEEAVKKERERSYDLIITDLMMPGISGLDLLKIIKDSRPGVSVIMVTGYPTIKTAVQSVKLGAFDYIPKPFTPAELRALVGRAFKKADSDAKGDLQPPVQKMPAGLYYMLGHTWMRVDGPQSATIGVVDEFLKSVGIITQLELPKLNGIVTQGEVCGVISDAEKYTHRIWSPGSGIVLEINRKVEEDHSLLRRSPYLEGWLFRIEPRNLDEDLKGLLLSK